MNYTINLWDTELRKLTRVQEVITNLDDVSDPAYAAAVALLRVIMPDWPTTNSQFSEIPGVGLVYAYSSIEQIDFDIEHTFIDNYQLPNFESEK